MAHSNYISHKTNKNVISRYTDEHKESKYVLNKPTLGTSVMGIITVNAMVALKLWVDSM